MRETEDRNCELVLTRAQLDYEKVKSYQVQVELTTLPGIISKKRSRTTVSVNLFVQDFDPAISFPVLIFLFRFHVNILPGSGSYSTLFTFVIL